MARGWESKAVESQQADAGRTNAGKAQQVSADDRARETQRRVLMLARARTADDLSKIEAPAQRQMLERALEDLDRTIAALTTPS